MPSPRVLDLTERPPEPTGIEKFFSKVALTYKDQQDQDTVGNILKDYQANRTKANAWEDSYLQLEKSNISPTRRVQAQKALMDSKKVIIDDDKALNAKYNKVRLTDEEKGRLFDTLVKSGYPEHAAEQYVNSSPGVQGVLAREHQVLTERGIRSPLVNFPKGSDQQQPENIEQPQSRQDIQAPVADNRVEPSAPQVSKDEWPTPDVPKNRTQEEIVKWEDNNQKENSKSFKETSDHLKLLRGNGTRISQMTKINDGKYLPDGFGRAIVVDPSTGEIRPTAQLAKTQNRETALYVKNLNQYLEGIKAQLGSVITDFDIRTFKSQLPSLLNDEQGRRIILKQMEYTNELETSIEKSKSEAIKHYGRNADPLQIEKVAQERVAETEKELIGKINDLVDASKYMDERADDPEKFRGTVLMKTPGGKYRSVPQEKAQYLEKDKKWRLF